MVLMPGLQLALHHTLKACLSLDDVSPDQSVRKHFDDHCFSPESACCRLHGHARTLCTTSFFADTQAGRRRHVAQVNYDGSFISAQALAPQQFHGFRSTFLESDEHELLPGRASKLSHEQQQAPSGGIGSASRNRGRMDRLISRPIIFEDVDGVLNRYEAGAPILEDGLISNLARVVKITDSNLVISSQWRKWPDDHMVRLKEALAKAGIDSERIIGQTPVLCSAWQCRTREIGKFLDSHPEFGHAGWVAVDDVNLESQDPGFMRGHFIKTDPMDGLTSEKADELEAMLQSPQAQIVRIPSESA